ncbi:hypothetical protein TIFTF001_017095 [Ficus carica]|uniref:Uncharacterized protein n=1 Tax=Ficus carica TaxID=3494 RepID=A0AA88A9Y1_FICCA|nr:hypothetical protein TIFTF001_017095 [Ficus carica]
MVVQCRARLTTMMMKQISPLGPSYAYGHRCHHHVIVVVIAPSLFDSRARSHHYVFPRFSSCLSLTTTLAGGELTDMMN